MKKDMNAVKKEVDNDRRLEMFRKAREDAKKDQ